MSALLAEAAVAAEMEIPARRFAELRRHHRWDHVRISRTDIRYTPDQVQGVVDALTVRPPAGRRRPADETSPRALPGQSQKAAARRRSP